MNHLIRNRTMQQGADQNVVQAIRKHLQGFPGMHLATKPFTPATLQDRIQARISATAAILAAKAAWEQAIRDFDALDGETDAVVRDLRGLISAIYGEESTEYADFGFAVRKKSKWTEEKKQLAVVRRAATRQARGTRGPKAKLAIKGVVTSTESAAPIVTLARG